MIAELNDSPTSAYSSHATIPSWIFRVLFAFFVVIHYLTDVRQVARQNIKS